jgi:hypothetical protein
MQEDSLPEQSGEVEEIPLLEQGSSLSGMWELSPYEWYSGQTGIVLHHLIWDAPTSLKDA